MNNWGNPILLFGCLICLVVSLCQRDSRRVDCIGMVLTILWGLTTF